ncbi:septal ring lytic transglycosylase RlpA family protein [Enemella evansiae]|uniref:septal ring lytic transglycosylase RlpA family protein n=1 Tax=Enemella evansiae TaxID=2016499 RepID=UPI00105FC362|nr:rare lipoprotein A [Enemella evansiae]
MSTSTKIARRLLGAGALGGVLVASLSTAAFACERTGGSSSSSGSQQRTVASRSASSDDGSQQRSSHHHTKHSRSHAGSTGSGSSDSNASGNRTVSRVSSGASAGASSAGTTSTGTASTGTASTGGTTCTASMYDEGQLTATGEQFDPQGLTAASLTLPLNSTATVTNPQNGKSVTVRINDRGPYISGRCIDLSAGAFAAIGDPNDGLMQVNVTPAG